MTTETAKKILKINGIVVIVAIICTIVMAFIGTLTSDMAIVTGSLITEYGAVIAFYLWKSKNENRAKYAQKFINALADKYGIQAAIDMSSVVLKD